jgi:hypothetical protein
MAMLAWICNIAAWVCSILVGVQAIKRQKVVPGIVSIICVIFGLIYGWMKATEWGIKNLMIAFTILFIAAIVLNAMAGPAFSVTTTP